MSIRRRFLRIDRGAKSVEHAVDDELQFHFDMTVEDLVAKGMTPERARREAARRFGDVQRTRAGLEAIDRSHAGRGNRAAWISTLMQDTRYALRGLRLTPDVRVESLSEPEYQYYMPMAQQYSPLSGLFVRTRGTASDEADQVRGALQRLMPGAAYVTVTPLSTIVEPEFASFRLGATMFNVFGVLALLVAAIGLYSSIAYDVTQRTHEMGLRVALGAESWKVVALIVRQGLQVVVPGIALGSGGALIAGRWIAPLLFNESPKDPRVIATVIAALLLAAIGASWLPARRASRVDANEALRAD